jgi:hypothetical protein
MGQLKAHGHGLVGLSGVTQILETEAVFYQLARDFQ